jgi:hypothetical protein
MRCFEITVYQRKKNESSHSSREGRGLNGSLSCENQNPHPAAESATRWGNLVYFRI